MDQHPPKDILDRMETAKAFVAAWYNTHVAGRKIEQPVITDEIEAGRDVWFSKTLKNWKALLSTTVDDGRYYEATYNGDKHELYLDVYGKQDNVTIKEELVGKDFDDTGYHTVPPKTKPAGGYTLPSPSPKMQGYLKDGLQHKSPWSEENFEVPPSALDASHEIGGEADKAWHQRRLAKLAADVTEAENQRRSPGGDWDMHPDDVEKDKPLGGYHTPDAPYYNQHKDNA